MKASNISLEGFSWLEALDLIQTHYETVIIPATIERCADAITEHSIQARSHYINTVNNDITSSINTIDSHKNAFISKHQHDNHDDHDYTPLRYCKQNIFNTSRT